jgi:hypothetical protein
LRGCRVGTTDERDLLIYDVEMASGGMIYIPSLIKIDSDIQKMFGEGEGCTYRHTDNKVIS